MLKNASLLYDKLVYMYKQECEQVFESKDESWRKRHDYKNLKDLDYEADKAKKKEKDEEDEED